MKRLFTLLACLALVAASSQAADTVRIIHLNDTHNNLMSAGPRTEALEGTVGGIARAATAIGMIKRDHPKAMIVHAGDIFVGDLFFQKFYGVAELQMLRALGVQVMTLGNHEFDLTPTALLGSYVQAFETGDPIQVVSANVILDDPAVEPLKAYVSAHTIINVDGIKVGVFGMTTPETNLLSLPAPAVIDTNIVQIAGGEVLALKTEGADVVIMLSHLGRHLDALVTAYVEGIDLVIGGHDHDIISGENPAGSTPIVQAGSFYRSIGFVELEVNDGNVTLVSANLIPLDQAIAEAGPIRAQVNNMATSVEETYGLVFTEEICEAVETIPELAEDLTTAGPKDVPLGNIVSEAYKAWGKTDIAVQACGSIAQPLYKGPIVGNDIFRSVGYGFNTVNGLGFRMTTFTVLGAEIMAGLEFGLSGIELNDEFFIQVAGLSYTYNPNASPYGRLVSVSIGDQPLNPMARYSVAANEMSLQFFEVIGITPQDIVVQEELTEYLLFSSYLKALGTVAPLFDGRIVSDPTSSVAEKLPITDSWFAAEARNDQIVVDLNIPFSESWNVTLYNTGLRELPIEAIVMPFGDGTRVIAPAHLLGSGIYVMTVQVGAASRAGRVLVTR